MEMRLVAGVFWRTMCFGVVSPDQWKNWQMEIGVRSSEEKYVDCAEVDLQWKNTLKDPYFQ